MPVAGGESMGGEPIGGSIDWPVIGQQVGLGMLLGFAVGYLAKKALKVALVVAGILFLLLVGLQHYDFIAINWTRMEETYSQALNPPSALDPVMRRSGDPLAVATPGAG